MPKTVYNIPTGPQQVSQIFALNVSDLEEYYLQVEDAAGDVVASTNLQQLNNCADYVRLHFVNRLGCVDAINFTVVNVTQAVSSDLSERAPSFPLIKSEHGIMRFNVSSNDTITAVNTDYFEEHADYTDELFASPVVWMESTVGFVPLVITDQKHEKRKQDDRFFYEITLEFTFSHSKINLRN